MIDAYENKTKGVKLLAAVAVLAMVVCAFAAIVPAEETDAAPAGVPTQIGGGINVGENDTYVVQSYTTGEVIVVSDFVIPDNTALVINGNVKFTVNPGVTITVEAGGQLIFASNADVTINGDIVAEGTNVPATGSSNTNEGYNAAIINNVTTTSSDENVGVKVYGDITLERGAELISTSSDVTIKEDSTTGTGTTDITIPAAASESSPGMLLQEGSNLTISKRTSNVSVIAAQTVNMVQGATFTMNGYAFDVDVNAAGTASNYTYGSMTINDGQAFSGTAKPEGNRDTSSLTFTVTTENRSAWNDDEAGTIVTLRQYVLNVDGTVDGAFVEGDPNGTLYADTLTINAGGTVGATTFYEVGSNNSHGDAISPMNSITGNLTVTDAGKLVVSGYVNMSGTATIDYDEDTTGGVETPAKNLDVNGGYIYVTGTINISSGTDSLQQTSGMLYIDGGRVNITDADETFFNGSLGMYGAFYVVEGVGTNPDCVYICDLDVAVAEAAQANAEDVWVVNQWKTPTAQSQTSVDDAIDQGAYVIDQDLTIPNGITLNFMHCVAILDNVTLTFADGSDAGLNYLSTGNIAVFVGGKLVDEGGVFERSENFILYEVKKLSEDESIATYTTLSIALDEAVAGETIQLNGTVVIREDLVIPADVTVVADEDASITPGLQIEDSTLTVNGVLDMNGKPFEYTIDTDTNNTRASTSSIVVNNYIYNVASENYVTDSADAAGAAPAGAYFQAEIDGKDLENIIASVSVAGENSSIVEGNIVVYGNVNMGDVTFTAAQDERLTIYIKNGGQADNEVARAGTVTLEGAVTLNTYNGDFTGSISGADAVVSLTNSRDMTLSIVPDESGETIAYDMVLTTKEDAYQSDGTATVVSGTVQIADTFSIAKITINDGAELVVPNGTTLITTGNPDYRINTLNKELPLITDSLMENISGLVVDGTLTIEKAGNVTAGIAVINGILTVGESAGNVSLSYAQVNGTLQIADNVDVDYSLLIVKGVVSGAVEGTATSGLIAYPEASIDGAEICYAGTTESQADVTTYYVNGTEYATVYAVGQIPVDAIVLFMDVPGYDADTSVFYSDESMRQILSDVTDIRTTVDNVNYSIASAVNALVTTDLDSFEASFGTLIETLSDAYFVGDYTNVYVGMDPSQISGTITTYNGLSIYIDGLSIENIPYSNGKFFLDVGQHTISVQISPAYTGTYEITLNGNAVTGNTFEITGDMTEFQIVVTGNLSQESVVIDNGSSDRMGLTDYLLIILVVLIVVMAIMVAMRLMRS